jgi:hypothetical protein
MRQPLVGQGLLISEASPSHSDTQHSEGLLWAIYLPAAETTRNTRKRQTSMPAAGFEHEILKS